MNKLTVGELAERTQTTRRALRLYEQIGLIQPERDVNGYRLYTQEHVDEVLLIRALRTIGASLKDLRDFYALKHSGLPKTEKHLRIVAMIDERVDLLLRQREAIDSALAQLGGYRDDLMAKIATDNDVCEDISQLKIEK